VYNQNQGEQYHPKQENNNIIKLISTIILALVAGISATWNFSTGETLSRPLRDGLSILTLFASLLVAGILIVVTLIRTDALRPQSK